MTYTVEPATIEAARIFHELTDRAATDWQRHDGEHSAAEHLVAAILAAWKQGDEGPTGVDHQTALSEVTRTETLRDRAASELRTRLNRTPLTTFELAQAVADRLEPIFGDLHMTITGTIPSSPSKVGGNPTLYLAQPKEAHDEGGGLLAATMQLVMYSDKLWKALPPTEDIESALNAPGWRVDVQRTTKTTEGVHKSEAKIEVRRGWAPIPYIDRRKEAKPNRRDNAASPVWQHTLAQIVADEVVEVAHGYSPTVSNPKAVSLGVHTDDSGVTTERVRLSLEIAARGAEGFKPRVILATAGARLRGALCPYLGVISESEAETEGAPALLLTAVRRQPTYAEADGGDSE